MSNDKLYYANTAFKYHYISLEPFKIISFTLLNKNYSDEWSSVCLGIFPFKVFFFHSVQLFIDLLYQTGMDFIVQKAEYQNVSM